MLAYSGKGRFVVEAMSLNRLVKEMAHLLEVTISKKVILKFDLAENLPAIEADASQVRQIVMNLITNASEAIGDRSGAITLASGVMEISRAYLKEVYLDEDLLEGYYIFLEVADTGCGMDEATRAKLFDPFFTTKFAGLGLGMSAVLGIVRGHGGAIKIYSEVGKGTTVKVLFPSSEEAPRKRPSGQDAESPTAWRGDGSILVADDEEGVLAMAKMMLERAGFKVLTARDGAEAVELFRDHADEISAVLLDMTMPKLNGEEAFCEMRQIRSDVCVILSSGYDEQDATDRFVGKGLAGFLQKPYDFDTLLTKLRQVLERPDAG